MDANKKFTSIDQEVISEQTEEIKRMLEFLLCDLSLLRAKKLLSKGSIYSQLVKLRKMMEDIELFCSAGTYIKLIDLDTYVSKLNSSFSSHQISLSFKNKALKEEILSLLKEIAKGFNEYSSGSTGFSMFNL